MKRIIYIFLLLPYFAIAQITPPIDTIHYLQKTNTVRTDTTATNLLTLNQSTNSANPMSGATLKAYFQNGLLKTAPAIPTLSKSANYTILSGDFGTAKTIQLSGDCTGGAFTVTLPTASTVSGYTAIITKSDATTNALTISGITGNNVMDSQKWSKSATSNGTIWVQN